MNVNRAFRLFAAAYLRACLTEPGGLSTAHDIARFVEQKTKTKCAP